MSEPINPTKFAEPRITVTCKERKGIIEANSAAASVDVVSFRKISLWASYKKRNAPMAGEYKFCGDHRNDLRLPSVE